MTPESMTAAVSVINTLGPVLGSVTILGLGFLKYMWPGILDFMHRRSQSDEKQAEAQRQIAELVRLMHNDVREIKEDMAGVYAHLEKPQPSRMQRARARGESTKE